MQTAILQVSPRGAVFHAVISVAPLKRYTELSPDRFESGVFHAVLSVAPLKHRVDRELRRVLLRSSTLCSAWPH